MKDADGVMKISCIHCKRMYTKTKTAATTQLHRHLQSCANYLKAKADKTKMDFCKHNLALYPVVDPTACPSLYVGTFDMEKMKESVAHWIMMHEHPIVEEDGFNLMQRRGMPEWRGMTRNTAKTYCINVYESEKKKLKSLLKNVNKISLTTDCWKSKNQKIEYMVITGHWIDESWQLQKRVLNFVHIPPPRRGLEIANAIWRCLEDWGIESKIHTISVDNASANDSAIENLKIYVRNKRRLLCEGRLFTVEYVRRSDARLKIFSEIVKQLNLPEKKLVDDCRTRWNSTYEMLAAAIKFKDVFPRFADRELHYDICPSAEDWTKAEKVCSVLELFWTATHIVSGSDYPTSNLFLNEVSRVKVLLDKKALENDIFIRDMVAKMKSKFDKYWGDSNLLMSIAAVLDPRCKLRALEFCFPRLYSSENVERQIAVVRKTLYELYSEYVAISNIEDESIGEGQKKTIESNLRHVETQCGWSEYAEYLKISGIYSASKKDKKDGKDFDVLEWWRVHALKYKILSIMARDLLAIPITTVASEATFSAGSRVIDKYRASLTSDTVQVLMCGGDWLRKRFGVKKKPLLVLKLTGLRLNKDVQEGSSLKIAGAEGEITAGFSSSSSSSSARFELDSSSSSSTARARALKPAIELELELTKNGRARLELDSLTPLCLTIHFIDND
ncbi:UNVERIFIED_CONTAM: Zinc finger BED domain-containing protein RICESLEEPER 2 [Sesamum angustifolium]|uniref:Zinc finger BED domain-containing protein RICESLEEPER 2 n=1 Tax=Sesamum angustifolium TaxID=2727405 RepID=A0AAW2RM03_9LAMI